MSRFRVMLGLSGAYALGFTTTWNLTNVGGAPERVADHFGVGLPQIGMLTSGLFLGTLLLQIPGGGLVDRFGPRRLGLGALLLVILPNIAILATSAFALAVVLRFIIGVGCGIGFIAGIAYVRALGGSASAQGFYGGIAIGGAGLAVSAVSVLGDTAGWQAPFVSSALVNVVGLLLLLVCPDPQMSNRSGSGRVFLELLRDIRVWRFSALHAATFGLSIVLGNWIVLLLTRNGGHSPEAAGAVGGLVLLGGVFGRPIGGWLAKVKPTSARSMAAVSLILASVATLLLIEPTSLTTAVIAASLVGLAAGAPFGQVFDGITRTRPDAPGAAAAVMNFPAMITVMVGTPLFGMSFDGSGTGRLGLAGVALLMIAALPMLPRRTAVVPSTSKGA